MQLEREDLGELFKPRIRKWSIHGYEKGNDIQFTDRLVQYAILGNDIFYNYLP